MVDIIIIGIIAFSILVSLWRGFVSEALSLGGWIIAFWVASSFYPYLSSYLAQINSVYLQNSEFLRNGVAAAILFIITLIVCGIISGLLQKMVDMTGVLSTTDRIAWRIDCCSAFILCRYLHFYQPKRIMDGIKTDSSL